MVKYSSLRDNRMGGIGDIQASFSATFGGAHVLAEGASVKLDSCTIEDIIERQALPNQGRYWFYAIRALLFQNSSFRSVTPTQGLVSVQGRAQQVLIRGCVLENVQFGTHHDIAPIGIVDTQIIPELDGSVPTVRPDIDGH